MFSNTYFRNGGHLKCLKSSFMKTDFCYINKTYHNNSCWHYKKIKSYGCHWETGWRFRIKISCVRGIFFNFCMPNLCSIGPVVSVIM